ncbi:MAG: dethiobiotin synthase [Acidobacteriota bacterium]
MRIRGLFVTGTDTGVGKTVVSAALMHRYRASAALRYWKPIQTGIEHDDDTADVERLGGCRAGERETMGIRLPRPVSPHLAARWHGTTISMPSVLAPLNHLPPDAPAGSPGPASGTTQWIVEGAGGVLVPINETETMADVMSALDLPVVVVARTALGTINHTLLTLQALRQRALHVAGVVMVGDRNGENRDAIEKYGDVTVIGEMPYFTPLDTAAVAGWAATGIDRDGLLLQWLR